MLASPEPGSERAVLEDATGRRGRWMRRVGRSATLLIFGWLVVLLLGGLGLTPVANLPLAGTLRPSEGPEPLAAVPKPRKPSPADLQPAEPVATRTTAPKESPAVSAPARSARPEPVRPQRRFTPKEPGRARGPTRTVARPTPVRPAPSATTTTGPPGQTVTAARGRSAQAPGRSGSEPPGQTTTNPGRSATAPGQVRKTITTTTTVTTTETVTTTHGPKGPKNP
jgi:hypothetical protein